MGEQDEQEPPPIKQPHLRENKPRPLYRAKSYSEVPKGAVLLSKAEVSEYVNRQLKKEKWSDVIGLKGNYFFTGGLAGATGLLLVDHYRRMFKLRQYGRLFTFGIGSVIPTLVALKLHNDQIKEKIITGYHGCSMCLGIRSGCVQLFSGVLYPLILAPVLCSISARANYTYAVPSFRNTSLMFNMIKTTSPPMSRILVIILGNFFLGSLLCEIEMKEYERFSHKFNPSGEDKEFFTDL